MLYELKQYDIDPERWEDYLAWADTWALPVLVNQFGFRLVGIWQGIGLGGSQPGKDVPATNLYWILAWESEQEMRERWAAVGESEAWRAAMAAATDPTTGERKYHLQTRSTLLRTIANLADWDTVIE